MLKKLAIVTTHPIQYNAPLFKLPALNGVIAIKVFYTWGSGALVNKEDPGFDRVIEWDIPLLDDYEYCFVENRSSNPGSYHYWGIVNPTLCQEIENWSADAVLIYGWKFHSHLKCLRYFHNRLPVLFRGDSTLLDEHPGIGQVLRRLILRWVYSHVDTAFFVGENNKRYFLSHGLLLSQLVYAPHAIDNERFAEPNDLYQSKAASMRQALGIQEEDLLLLFAGKFEPKKNPLYLIKLLQSIPDKRFKILFVGSGVLLPQIQSAAEQDGRILLMDFQNQQRMPVIYRMADLFILPSAGPGETWGLAINEAMACGRAVAVTDKVGGAVDLVEQGINGLIINSQDDSALIKLIKAGLQDRGQLQAMGKQSGLKIQSFALDLVAKAIEETVT